MTVLVTVSNSGEKKYSTIVDVPMPSAKRDRNPATAKYEFNSMKLGQCIFAATEEVKNAMVQAFNSKVYEPAQLIGRLSARNLDKYPEIKRMHGQPDGSYGLWLVPHKEKKKKA